MAQPCSVKGNVIVSSSTRGGSCVGSDIELENKVKVFFDDDSSPAGDGSGVVDFLELRAVSVNKASRIEFVIAEIK